MAGIDWHDFKVVETIEFDDLEPAMERLDIGQKEEEDAEMPEIEEFQEEEVVEELQEEEDKQEEEEEEESEEVHGIKVVKNYTRVSNNEVGKERCPICKAWVSSKDMAAHLKADMKDERFEDVKKEWEERKKQVNTVSDERMVQTIKEFARNRPDLFDLPVDEKEEVQQRKVWDGIAPNLTRTSANIAMIHHSTLKNYDASIEQLDLPKIQRKQAETKQTFLFN